MAAGNTSSDPSLKLVAWMAIAVGLERAGSALTIAFIGQDRASSTVPETADSLTGVSSTPLGVALIGLFVIVPALPALLSIRNLLRQERPFWASCWVGAGMAYFAAVSFGAACEISIAAYAASYGDSLPAGWTSDLRLLRVIAEATAIWSIPLLIAFSVGTGHLLRALSRPFSTVGGALYACAGLVVAASAGLAAGFEKAALIAFALAQIAFGVALLIYAAALLRNTPSAPAVDTDEQMRESPNDRA